jgi:DNA-binding ferritin-like protein
VIRKAPQHLAHWNIEGPDFFEIHTAFEKQYEELFEVVDEIAERIRALDAYANGACENWPRPPEWMNSLRPCR